MKNKNQDLGGYAVLMAFGLLQLISVLILFLTNEFIISAVMYLVAALGIFVTSASLRGTFNVRFVLATTLLGLLFYLVYAVIGLSQTFILLVSLLMITELVVLVVGISTKRRKPKVEVYHEKQKPSKKEVEKEREEVKNIFRELDKIEKDLSLLEVEADKKETKKKPSKKKATKKKAKKKSTTKKKAKKTKSTTKKKSAKTVTAKRFSSVKGAKTFHLPTCSILLRADSKEICSLQIKTRSS